MSTLKEIEQQAKERKSLPIVWPIKQEIKRNQDLSWHFACRDYNRLHEVREAYLQSQIQVSKTTPKNDWFEQHTTICDLCKKTKEYFSHNSLIARSRFLSFGKIDLRSEDLSYIPE